MRRMILAFLLLLSVPCFGAVKTLQVTLGSGNTSILSAGAHLNAVWFTIQDNAGHNIRIGDTNISTTRGIALQSGGGSFYVGPALTGTGKDLGTWYLNGTNGDVIDVIYDDGQ